MEAPKPVLVQNILRLGSPPCCWSSVTVQNDQEAELVRQGLTAQGVYTLKGGLKVWAFSTNAEQLVGGPDRAHQTGVWTHEDSPEEVSAAMLGALEEFVSRSLRTQFEPSGRYFLLPVNSGFDCDSPGRFRVRLFIHEAIVYLQVLVGQQTEHSAVVRLQAAASLQLHALIQAPRAATSSVQSAQQPAVNATTSNKPAPPPRRSAPAAAAEKAAFEPEAGGWSVTDVEPLAAPELVEMSMPAASSLCSAEEVLDEMSTWLDGPAGVQGGAARCFRYLGAKERAMLERQEAERDRERLAALEREQQQARMHEARCRVSAPKLAASGSQRTAMARWFGRPRNSYSKSSGAARRRNPPPAPSVVRPSCPAAAELLETRKKPRVEQPVAISSALAQLILDQSWTSLDAAAASTVVDPPGRSSMIREVHKVLQGVLGPVSPVQPSQHLPTPAPPMLASFGDSQVLVSPAALASWERARLQPYGEAAHACYFLVCPDVECVRVGASEFLMELSGMFASLCLGTHVQAPKRALHFVSCAEAEVSSGSFHTTAEGWSTAFGAVADVLEQHKGSTPVVYVVGEAEQTSWALLSELYSQCERRGCADPVVQSVPLEHVTALAHPIEVVKEVAMAVYLKLRRAPPTAARSSVVPYTGQGEGWCVSRARQAGLVTVLTEGEPGSTTHCCYCHLKHLGCLAAAWSDEQGAELHSFLGFGDELEPLLAQCWAAKGSMGSGASKLVVTCLGVPEEAALSAWRGQAAAHGYSVQLLAVQADESCVLDLDTAEPDGCAVLLPHPVEALGTRVSAIVNRTRADGTRQGYRVVHTEDHSEEAAGVLQQVVKQFNALSWLCASPLHLDRPSPLPLHCAVVSRMVAGVQQAVAEKPTTGNGRG